MYPHILSNILAETPEERGYIAGYEGLIAGDEDCPEEGEAAQEWWRGWHEGLNARRHWIAQIKYGCQFGFLVKYEIRKVQSADVYNPGWAYQQKQWIAEVLTYLIDGTEHPIHVHTGPDGYGLWFRDRPILGLGQFYAPTFKSFKQLLELVLDSMTYHVVE